MIHSQTLEAEDIRQCPANLSGDGMALLYQGILTAIVRIQSGKQPIASASSFQTQMEVLLTEIERQGRKDGYRDRDIVDSRYVAVAFLDEAILRSNDPARHQWTSLHTRLFGHAVAGEAVFDRLKSIRARRDSPELADVLEVYLLCLLLGYEGRYAIEGGPGLAVLIEELQDQIERIRGRQEDLSPEGLLKSGISPSTRREVAREKLKWIAVASAGIACFCLAVLNWGFLAVAAAEVAEEIGRS